MPNLPQNSPSAIADDNFDRLAHNKAIMATLVPLPASEPPPKGEIVFVHYVDNTCGARSKSGWSVGKMQYWEDSPTSWLIQDSAVQNARVTHWLPMFPE